MARVDGVIGDANAKKYFYHTDQVGSVRAVSDNAGKVVWKADYLAFGKQFGKDKLDPSFEEDEFAFTGKGFDGDTGLYYYNARWYDAETGRFISEDPIGDPNNPNLYVYCANNPLKFIDPTGTISQEEGMAQAAANTTTHSEGSTESFTSLSGNTISGTYGSNGSLATVSISHDGNTISQTTLNSDGTWQTTFFDSKGKKRNTIDYDKDGKWKKQTTFHDNGKVRSITTYDKKGFVNGEIIYNEKGYMESMYLTPDFIENPENQDLLDEIRDKVKEEYNKLKEKYTNPKELANKVMEKIFNNIAKDAAKAIAAKLGLETISKLTSIATDAAFTLKTGIPRAVGYAAAELGAIPTIGISVLTMIAWDMISPEPCY